MEWRVEGVNEHLGSRPLEHATIIQHTLCIKTMILAPSLRGSVKLELVARGKPEAGFTQHLEDKFAFQRIKDMSNIFAHFSTHFHCGSQLFFAIQMSAMLS